MEKFAIGLLIGGCAGALLTANNYKMRMLVKKGQEEVQEKLNKLMDDKLKEFEKGAKETDENADTDADKSGKKMRGDKKADK